MGLKPSQVAALERLYRRKVPPDELITPELAARMVDITRDIRRRVGILVNRHGSVEYVIIGDERELFIPDLSDYPLGRRLLRGLRYIHTHLRGGSFSEDDLTDLALLRFDLMAVIQVHDDDRRLAIQTASLNPSDDSAHPYRVEAAEPLAAHRMDFGAFISNLERSLEKAVATESREVAAGQERAILISVTKQPREEAEDSMDELRELARTAGVAVLDAVIQRPRQFNPRYLMGEGKTREVLIRALQLGATLLIFDQELSPAQVRSISALTELKVIDRSQLILDIFARRATSLDGKVQVELAQLKYILPRLTGRGVQMSRLMGGSAAGGPARPSWRSTAAASGTASPSWSGSWRSFPGVASSGARSGCGPAFPSFPSWVTPMRGSRPCSTP